VRPQSDLPQFHAYYDDVALPHIRAHQRENVLDEWRRIYLPYTMGAIVPHRLLMILMPLSLVALNDRRRIAMGLGLPLYIGLYVFYTFFSTHYAMVALPAVLLMILLGVKSIELAWPHRRPMTSALYLLIAILCVSNWPGINRLTFENVFDPARSIDRALTQVERPAVVLFRAGPGHVVHHDPVYNTDVAWPDDAPVVRAHDLGEQRNQSLLRHYADNQPDRTVYRFDLETGNVKRLGRVTDLARGR
jgi:hypothetical protein